MKQYNKYPDLKGLPPEERNPHYYAAYRARNPERMLWRAAKDRAKKRGVVFQLDVEDIVIPEKCPILDIPIVIRAGINGERGGKMDSPSLDRIDNDKGYVKGNVQVISHQANSMKFTATPAQLLKFADWIKETYSE
ncbi:MAG: putative restriction endonuclease [Podoviridae sp. ctbj_2]|nr:MAG: putative restriction endonuclease [Podoviridae sp. ctbj_2]